jgi:hypothetical protein
MEKPSEIDRSLLVMSLFKCMPASLVKDYKGAAPTMKLKILLLMKVSLLKTFQHSTFLNLGI